MGETKAIGGVRRVHKGDWGMGGRWNLQRGLRRGGGLLGSGWV